MFGIFPQGNLMEWPLHFKKALMGTHSASYLVHFQNLHRQMQPLVLFLSLVPMSARLEGMGKVQLGDLRNW